MEANYSSPFLFVLVLFGLRIKLEIKDFDENLLDKKSLGVGSIAQVHKYGNSIIKITHQDINKLWFMI